MKRRTSALFSSLLMPSVSGCERCVRVTMLLACVAAPAVCSGEQPMGKARCHGGRMLHVEQTAGTLWSENGLRMPFGTPASPMVVSAAKRRPALPLSGTNGEATGSFGRPFSLLPTERDCRARSREIQASDGGCLADSPAQRECGKQVRLRDR